MTAMKQAVFHIVPATCICFLNTRKQKRIYITNLANWCWYFPGNGFLNITGAQQTQLGNQPKPPVLGHWGCRCHHGWGVPAGSGIHCRSRYAVAGTSCCLFGWNSLVVVFWTHRGHFHVFGSSYFVFLVELFWESPILCFSGWHVSEYFCFVNKCTIGKNVWRHRPDVKTVDLSEASITSSWLTVWHPKPSKITKIQQKRSNCFGGLQVGCSSNTFGVSTLFQSCSFQSYDFSFAGSRSLIFVFWTKQLRLFRPIDFLKGNRQAPARSPSGPWAIISRSSCLLTEISRDNSKKKTDKTEIWSFWMVSTFSTSVSFFLHRIASTWFKNRHRKSCPPVPVRNSCQPWPDSGFWLLSNKTTGDPL